MPDKEQEDRILCDECRRYFNPADLTDVLYHMRHEPVPVLLDREGNPIRGERVAEEDLNGLHE